MKLYNISLSNLKRRKARLLFLVFGLFIGIATIVALLSITAGMTEDIEERLNKFGANIVIVPKSENLALSYGGISVGGVNFQTVEFDEKQLLDIRKIRNSKNLGIVAPKVLGVVNFKERNVLLMGVDFEEELALKTWWMFKGAFPQKPTELIIGDEVSKKAGIAVGDKIMLNGKNFKVTAVLNPLGTSEDGIIIGDLHEIQKVLGKEGKISMIEVSAFCRGCPISEMTLQIAEKFPNGKVTALKQSVMAKMQTIDMIKTFSFGISVLVIFVGSLLVFVTMMGSVNERTREIGIFRAIGFRKGHIMQIILFEAMLIGIAGGVTGYFSGNGIAAAIIPYIIEGGKFSGFDLSLGGTSILLSLSLSLFASLYPAHKASMLDPGDALRAL